VVRGDKVDELIKVRSFYIISASVPAGEWCGGVGFIVTILTIFGFARDMFFCIVTVFLVSTLDIRDP